MATSLTKGLVQVYTGNGKGKTTAALGLTLRAAGAGLKVYIMQFIKRSAYSEIRALAKLKSVTIDQCGRGCFIKGKPKPVDIAHARAGLAKAAKRIASGKYSLVILDELNVALNAGLIKTKDVIRIIQKKPKKVELVLTGRYCPSCVMKHADLVTEMRKIRHPYDKGLPARRGIEF
jgi:cob(I)alamin adenosyltransferase